MINIITLMLNSKIKDADQDYNLYKYMGWSLEWPLTWRNILIRALTEHQLNNFRRE